MNIILNRENTQTLRFTRRDKSGNPVIQIPDRAYLTVKEASLPKTALLQKTISDISISNGEYRIQFNPEDFVEIEDGTYRYDFEIIYDGKKKTLANGYCIIQSKAGKIVDLHITRGDSKGFSFFRKNEDEEIITSDLDSIDFIVMKSGNEVIHKTLDNGISKSQDGKWTISLDPEDTDGLAFGPYPYKIKIIDMEVQSLVAGGSLFVEEEVTFAENEV